MANLKRDSAGNTDEATAIHHSVGKKVRAAIERVGGTMPENLPTPVKSISQIEKEQLTALKKRGKTLMLDE